MKGNGKLLVCGVCGLIAAASCMTACGPKGAPIDLGTSLEEIMSEYDSYDYTYTGEPCTIRMAHWDGAGPIEKATTELVVEGFEKRYPMINVELDIISNYADTYSKTIASGNLHDVFMVSDGEFALWADGGKMQNLSPFLASSNVITPDLLENDIFEGALERYQHGAQNTLLCFPKDIGSYVMYYNKDIFDRLGVAYPPSDRIMSVPEAYEMWTKLTKKEASGRVSIYGLAALTGEGLVWSAGGDFLNADRTAFPTDEKSRNALKQTYTFLQKALVEDEIIPNSAVSGGLSGMDMFSAEKAATVVGGRWDVSNLRSMKFNWDVAYVPAYEGENMQKNYWSGSVGYAMFNGSEHKEAAWKLIEYFGSPEGQAILAASGFSVPIYNSVAYDEKVIGREKSLGPQNYEVFIESAKHQPAGTHTYLASQRWLKEGYEALAANLYALEANNRWTVDRYLSEVEKKVNEFLK